MHIVHMIDNLGVGGAQRLLVLFAEEARLRGIKATVISLGARNTSSLMVDALESQGVQVVLLSIYKLYDLAALPGLLKALRRQNIDVLQTHLRHSNILGVIAGRLMNIPVVATLHSTHANPVGRFFKLRLLSEKFLLRFGANRIIAVGQMIGEIYGKKLIDKKVDIVPNPVKSGPALNLEKRNALRQEIAGNSDRFLVLTVGRLKPEKGLRDLLMAFAQVHEKHPATMLIVVGDGEIKIKSDLASQVSLLGLTEDVCFTGERNDVQNILAAGDMYVSSSYREGLSLAMLEAMAAGLPTLATNVGDSEILLNDGRGLLVPPHDATALVDGMCFFIENPQKMEETSCSARQFVEANYSPGRWMDRLFDVYEKARSDAN